MSTNPEKPTRNEDLFENSSSSSSVPHNKSLELESVNSAAEREGGEHGNILAQYTEEQVMQMGRNYAHKYDLDPDLFGRAAALLEHLAPSIPCPFLPTKKNKGCISKQPRNGTSEKID